MKKRWLWLGLLCAAAFTPVVWMVACTAHDHPIQGRVMDVDGRPLSNVVVLVKYEMRSGLAERQSSCPHVDVAISATDGTFAFPERSYTRWIVGTEEDVFLEGFRAGYEDIGSSDPSIVRMRPRNDSKSERFEKVWHRGFQDLGCGSEDGSQEELYLVHLVALDELVSLADSDKRRYDVQEIKKDVEEEALRIPPARRAQLEALRPGGAGPNVDEMLDVKGAK